MKISIFYYDNKRIKHIHLNTWIILCFLGAVLLGIYTYLVQETPEDLQFLQSHYQRHKQKSEVVKYQRIKNTTESQLKLVREKLIYIESQLNRMEILSQSIIKKFKISQDIKANKSIRPKTKKFEATSTKELIRILEEVDQTIETLEQDYNSLKILETVARTHHSFNKRNIAGLPIRKGWLSSPYGYRKDPFSGKRAMHKGIDFAGKPGSPVIATGAGIVIWAGKKFGYGQLVEIDHGNGFKTRYGHNKKISVKIGDIVTRGQEIARIGSTGRSTGPHVHYEVWRRERQVDPSRYIHRIKN
jgi:murein DD-endopeptidase MepM/ murein hydrolase activator NlpD